MTQPTRRSAALRPGLLAAALGTAAAAHGYRRWATEAARVRLTYDYTEPARPAPVAGAPLAARVLGREGRRVALLVHGLAASSRSWGAGYDVLAADHRLVVPDLLGFGASPRPGPGGYTLAAHADALAATLVAAAGDGAPPARPVVVAHSFGVCVALAMARRHPELVGGIVAVSPPLYRNAAHARGRMVGALTWVERRIAMDTAAAQSLCTAVCMQRPRLARALARRYRPELPAAIAVDGVAHTWTSYSESLAELLRATARPEWAWEAGIPLRVLTGESDLLPDVAYLRELAGRSPLVSVEIAPRGDHLVLLSHRARILELLAEVEAETVSRSAGRASRTTARSRPAPAAAAAASPPPP